MILVDTSIWIAVIRGEIEIDDDEYEDFFICGPILQEVFQGIEEGALLFAISNIPCLSDPLPSELFRIAAGIYSQGRRRGLTIRSAMDCLVAAIALDNGATVWHRDRDFDNIAQFTNLKVRRSLGAN